jgi:hypothetical protein
VKRALIFAVLAAIDCGKSPLQSATVPPASATGAVTVVDAGSAADDAAVPMDPRELAQWAAAKDGDPEELGRLARLVGCEGLRERADTPELRITAARAMQHCGDFSELPWLAQLAAGASDDEARAALESIVELAARPRRATDPEDADELHAGCAALLDLARATDRPKDRRVLAIRSLRMLADRGCVKPADVPTDLDAH